MTIAWGDLEALDVYLGGKLTEATDHLSNDRTLRAAEALKDAADAAFLKHEQTHGLLTPEAIADRQRREAQGRMAAERDARARDGMIEMEIGGVRASEAFALPQSTGGQAAPACMRGLHRFGALRGANGEAQCLDCQVVFVAPPIQGQLPPGAS